MSNLRFAFNALSRNKLRAFLTMLGIIIGVAAVITLQSIGEGVSTVITGEFEGLGNNLLFVLPGQIGPESNQPRRRPGGAGLSDRDFAALADPARVPSLLRVAPVYDRPAIVTQSGEETRTTISGTTPEFAQMRNFNVQRGNFFNNQDLAAASRVAVIGQTVYDELFPDGGDPIGADIKINNVVFTIIGLLDSKGSSGFNDENDVIIVPMSTSQRRLFQARRADGSLRIDYILAETLDENLQDTAIVEMQIVLRETHRIGLGEEDDFSVVSQADLVGAFSQVTSIITLFLSLIAGISLVVGGIGIMNIMLVSVTERTKEIGLRKALGAKQVDILGQFMVEATVLAILGGVIGLLLGTLATYGIASLSDQLQPVVNWRSVVMALSVSAAIGLVFGVFPASRAARLNPIEALRYE